MSPTGLSPTPGTTGSSTQTLSPPGECNRTQAGTTMAHWHAVQWHPPLHPGSGVHESPGRRLRYPGVAGQWGWGPVGVGITGATQQFVGNVHPIREQAGQCQGTPWYKQCCGMLRGPRGSQGKGLNSTKPAHQAGIRIQHGRWVAEGGTMGRSRQVPPRPW